ncbi:cobalamin binding intrinsic factor-like [Triplophysa dalaica]|uniref:cobalamin binding intrinsic factor-like n=1 Tax=Triplophysa dalaica TaxID=1582913 RepID=UPI0024DFDF04|nr:cobalamin binding intrinsic factor-like [Triplophysa dalaica]
MASSKDIALTVINTLTQPPKISNYSTSVIEGAVLFGALNNLQDSKEEFCFTYTIDRNFGLYLESVNNVKGSKEDHTFWQLLTKTPSGEVPLTTGIGCYQPKKDEHIILKFRKWDEKTCI